MLIAPPSISNKSVVPSYDVVSASLLNQPTNVYPALLGLSKE